jgi:hypothetical protein
MRGLQFSSIPVSVVLLACFTSSANAETVTFDLSGTADSDSAFSVTKSGLTLSFSNANGDGLFDSDSDGLAIVAGYFFPSISEFDFSFDKQVRLLSYTLEFIDIYGDESFTVTGANGASIEQAPFVDGVDRTFANTFLAEAGETLTLTTTFDAAGEDIILQMYDITVQVVPVPAAAWLFGSSLGFLAWMRRKTN